MEHQCSILHLKTRNRKATTGLLKKGVVEHPMTLYRDGFRPQHTDTHSRDGFRPQHTDTQTHTHAHMPSSHSGQEEVLIKAVTVFLTSLDI